MFLLCSPVNWAPLWLWLKLSTSIDTTATCHLLCIYGVLCCEGGQNDVRETSWLMDQSPLMLKAGGGFRLFFPMDWSVDDGSNYHPFPLSTFHVTYKLSQPKICTHTVPLLQPKQPPLSPFLAPILQSGARKHQRKHSAPDITSAQPGSKQDKAVMQQRRSSESRTRYCGRAATRILRTTRHVA